MHASIAAHLGGTGISASQAGRILAGLELAPHRVRGWLNRRDDDQFWAQAAAVSEVYLRPPEHTVVICIDEKTGIQATYRKYPERQPQAGWPADPRLNIHLIMDNGSPRTPRYRAQTAAQPRITVTYTPKHASWLDRHGRAVVLDTDQVLLRRGEFTSRADLAGKMTSFAVRFWFMRLG